jgi:hypothetical protein
MRKGISKSDRFQRIFELACRFDSRYTQVMNDTSGTSYSNTAFLPFVPLRSQEAIESARQASATAPSIKRSAVACAFLVFYVGAYLGVGYAGFTVIERAWFAIFR